MFVAAVMRVGDEQAPVRIRNMSANGALIETPVAPRTGTSVIIARGSLVAEGVVMWSSEKKCGLRFSSELSVKDWLAPPAKIEQQRVDDIVALVKAGGGGSSGVPLPEPAPRSAEPILDRLERVIGLIQELENDLISSDETVARHGAKLQNLDLALQIIRSLSRDERILGN